MKTNTLLFILVFVMVKLQAQDYLISFTATGASTTIESILVKNLNQNTSVTLNGTDVLDLKVTSRLNTTDIYMNKNLFIYPNPMTENSSVEFESSYPGMTTLELYNMAGKRMAQTQNILQPGWHIYTLSGLSCGFYTLIIRSDEYFYSGKLICQNSGPGDGKISFVSSNLKSAFQGNFKSNKSLVPMDYQEGDQLLITCFSGKYTTIIPLVPTDTMTVTANFVACTDADSNDYPTVTIGTKVWMAQNLNVGGRINGRMHQTNNDTIEKYCYDDLETNCDVYGGLYQWGEMMKYVLTDGAKGICPVGWHIPTDAELTAMTTLLGGISVAGSKMKESEQTHWTLPNSGASNSSGFSALPGGYRDGSEGFSYLTYYAYFWSSTKADNPMLYAWFRGLSYDGWFLTKDMDDKESGFSVRCMKN